MADIARFPYIDVEFTKDGEVFDAADVQRVKDFVSDNQVSDLFVVSHGWNNNTAEARELFEGIFGSARAVLESGQVGLPGRTPAVLGVLWPSKKFTDKDLIPGGGAASIGRESPDAVDALLGELDAALDSAEASTVLTEVKALIANLEDDPAAREAFADKVRDLLPRDAVTADDGSDQFFALSAGQLFDRLDAPFLFMDTGVGPGGGAAGVGGVGGVGLGSAGGAAGLGDFFSGARAAARRLLNYATYYLMKARAGQVGAKGVTTIVSALRERVPAVKLHLVGHSFGGRVVTAAAQALGEQAGTKPHTMSLLQAAFSHNGFAENFQGEKDGFFRSVLAAHKVAGPVVVTHTHNDRANAIAYPIASRLAGQDAAAVGGPDDRFGSIGANGAQMTPEAEPGTLLDAGAPGYAFQKGKLYNLNADAQISGHGDVEGRAVAYAILSAVAVT